jgi:hypothetical protein
VSRRAWIAVPLILLVVVAIVAVSLAGGDDDGSKSRATTGATSFGTSSDAQAAPEPQASPESAARLNRVIARVQRRALAEAPDVAGPIISKAQSAGRITAAEGAALRRAARALARGKGVQQLAGTVDVTDPGVSAVVRKSLAALKPRARQLAKPILARAIARGDITRAQAADVRAFVDAGGGYTLP